MTTKTEYKDEGMKSIFDVAKPEIAHQTYKCLDKIFAEAGEKLGDYKVQVVDKKGVVAIEGISCTYTSGSLRMIGICPYCGLDVPSGPIRKFSDFSDLLYNFRPGRHDCMGNQ